MNYRRFGRLGWRVGEVGYGMWGLADWKDSDPAEINEALDLAVDLGYNFFDTALAYGNGASEKILGNLVRRQSGKKLIVASKIPPKNREWPAKPGTTAGEIFPREHIVDCVETSLKNLGLDTMDFVQFHVWHDDWHGEEDWKEAVAGLRRSGKIQGLGISINRWEPENVIESLKTGLVDAVQVIYNIFDQAPEDNLFPFCQKEDIAVIARVPFDEGSLIGNLTEKSKWPDGDWRNLYFNAENLKATVERVAKLKSGMENPLDLPKTALRFALHHEAVSTVIPGMRSPGHVRLNHSASAMEPLGASTLDLLRGHRWDRVPTPWSM